MTAVNLASVYFATCGSNWAGTPPVKGWMQFTRIRPQA
jgi:hypothetical protein